MSDSIFLITPACHRTAMRGYCISMRSTTSSMSQAARADTSTTYSMTDLLFEFVQAQRSACFEIIQPFLDRSNVFQPFKQVKQDLKRRVVVDLKAEVVDCEGE